MKTFSILLKQITESKEGEKITRNAFIYMPPKGDKNNFAQCGTCINFLPEDGRCAIMGKSVEIDEDDSCGLYVNGTPNNDQECVARVTPEQAGLVDSKVRCENCRAFDGGWCELYGKINKALPETFDLEEKVDAKACCNAWME